MGLYKANFYLIKRESYSFNDCSFLFLLQMHLIRLKLFPSQIAYSIFIRFLPLASAASHYSSAWRRLKIRMTLKIITAQFFFQASSILAAKSLIEFPQKIYCSPVAKESQYIPEVMVLQLLHHRAPHPARNGLII